MLQKRLKTNQRVCFDLHSVQSQSSVNVRKSMRNKVTPASRVLADSLRSARALHLCSWFLVQDILVDSSGVTVSISVTSGMGGSLELTS